MTHGMLCMKRMISAVDRDEEEEEEAVLTSHHSIAMAMRV